ncbi:MAG: hypothetical protein A2087_06145 [Spirochaetes bacterium GWD1_61_31]|nr:MAG: hypothetical protein A2087_06145 [Spirochaetes bacterium GWD1_61_31]OHD44700.1 MAG: hypothetical protein A2Y35_01120 [Spirochaetes bacterium GWE1_60_18]HAP43373.1 hypothetical protein [Spirochaetaceae bacterium]HAW86899.1 hypothetical protein [Spirochaetaceae bacterium]HAX37166.1 hypothetical protein [Spirochaetaceae bacterium]
MSIHQKNLAGTTRRAIGLVASLLFGFSLHAQTSAPILIGPPPGSPARLPDLTAAGQWYQLGESDRIDIVILGDGFLAADRARFDRYVAEWYGRFSQLSPFRENLGAFRVLSLWTPGADWASPRRRSFFQVPLTADNAVGEEIPPETAAAIEAALAPLDCSTRLFPGSRRFSHCYVVLLVKSDAAGGTPSGRPWLVRLPASQLDLPVAVGEDALHEFCHSFAYLNDEYIGTAGSWARADRGDWAALFDADFFPAMHNVSRTPVSGNLPWQHLVPGGNLNPGSASLVGRLWLGGEGAEFGAWHSQATCLMNGGHANWDLARAQRGAWLRDPDNLCLWCQELTAAWLWFLGGGLGDIPAGDVAAAGEAMWQRWVLGRANWYRTSGASGRLARLNTQDLAQGLSRSRLQSLPLAPALDPERAAVGFSLRPASGTSRLAELAGSPARLALTSAVGSGAQAVSGADRWQAVAVGGGYWRLCNFQSGRWLTVENGRLACLDIRPGAWSSHWQLLPQPDGSCLLRNRWEQFFVVVLAGNAIGLAAEPGPGNGLWRVLY